MHGFTAVFLVALGLTILARLWLSQRHIRYVLANRNAVPAEFSASIPLAAHQKAADYTAAKTRLGVLETLAAAALLLGFTLGGGMQFLSDAWERIFEAGGYAHGIALIVSVVLVSSALDLPFSLYRTFVIEARLGFNRMSLALFIADLAKLAAIGALIGIPLASVVLSRRASLVILWLLGWLIGQEWFYAALGVRSRSTAMALVLFFMVVPVFTFLLQPLASWYSRLHEFEADAYAARVADPRDLARALVKLYEDNAATLTPDPLHSAFYDSHPPALLRIARLHTQQA